MPDAGPPFSLPPKEAPGFVYLHVGNSFIAIQPDGSISAKFGPYAAEIFRASDGNAYAISHPDAGINGTVRTFVGARLDKPVPLPSGYAPCHGLDARGTKMIVPATKTSTSATARPRSRK
ncbi:MAG: hypothetical protein ACRELY_32770 [Polyangiaceae bacterium]